MSNKSLDAAVTDIVTRARETPVELLTPAEAAALVKRKRSTFAIWRFRASKLEREGKPVPPAIALKWVNLNGRIYYRRSDVENFLSSLRPTLRTQQPATRRAPSPGRPSSRKTKRAAA